MKTFFYWRRRYEDLHAAATEMFINEVILEATNDALKLVEMEKENASLSASSSVGTSNTNTEDF